MLNTPDDHSPQPNGAPPPSRDTSAPLSSNLQKTLGQRDPASGRLVLAPQHTLPTADAYLRHFNQLPGGQVS